MKIRFILLLVLSCSHVCFAQTQPDPDWPCVQVLVPEISAASIWDGPPIDELEENERFSQSSRDLVFAVVEQHQSLTESQLDEFIAQFDTDQHNSALTFLFKSFLNTFNTKRDGQIQTIKRYTRSQVKSAKMIEDLMDQKADLENLQDNSAQLEEVDANLHWQKRMFKEREQSFNYFCDLPQEIAQQAGEVARMISAKLTY